MRCEQYKTVCTRIWHNNIAVCGFFIDFHCVIRRLANTIQPYAYIYCLKLPSAHSDNKENDEINDQNRQKSENRNARKHSKMFFSPHSFHFTLRDDVKSQQNNEKTTQRRFFFSPSSSSIVLFHVFLSALLAHLFSVTHFFSLFHWSPSSLRDQLTFVENTHNHLTKTFTGKKT